MSFAKGIKFSVFGNEILEWFLPSRCGACGDPLVRSERALCTTCLRRLPRTQSHRWTCSLLEEKLYGRIPMHPAYSFLVFSRRGMTRELLHHIKYEGRKDLAWQLGRMYALELRESGVRLPSGRLVPVPLHWRRAWKRGYNQAAWFARGIASVTGIPVDEHTLQRVGAHTSQTRKTRQERWGRMQGQFSLRKNARVAGSSLLIVDDVLTTGSTVEACAKVLREAGAARTGILTLAVVK